MNNIEIKNKHKRYFLLQRNSYLSSVQKKIRKFFGRYLFTNFFIFFFNSISQINKKLNEEFNSEFKEILKYLPKRIKNVVDIGSGIGIIDIYLNNHFSNDINFTLIDKNHIEKKVSYGFDAKGQFYNNFNLTKDFLLNHGINNKKLILVDADEKDDIDNKFDLVISLLSMGYHYPISQYLDFLKKNTHSETVFIFDIANEYSKLNDISKLFQKIEVIKESSEIRHNYVRICCEGIVDLKSL